MSYDPTSRLFQTSASATTQFLYDGLNPVQELQSGSPSANLLTGLGIDEYFTRADSAGARDFLTDALGSTLALSDSTGTVQTAYAYEPFGNTTLSGASSTNAFQFTGRENDGTGLYFYRARYYNPAFQKFISQDPIGFAAGNANLYQYAFDAPTMANDPLGLLTFSIGFSVNLQVGPVNLSGSAGIAVDTCGGVGAYSTGGIGAGAGAEGNGGLTIGYSNAPNIGDLAGPFANSEFGAGLGPAGSLGVFTGGSPDGQVIGGNLTIGLGGGAGSSVSLTGTRVTPLNSSPCSCH